ncbi:MAG: DUF2178 domain-containing protein [Sedimentisphaerales bacterium]
MKRIQKIAWSFVISMTLAMVLCIFAFVVRLLNICSPMLFIYLAAGAMGAGVFIAFCTKPDKGNVTVDERDRLIEKNAQLAGFGVVWLIVILAFILFFAIAPNAKISSREAILLFAAIVLGYPYVMFISILIQYGRETKEKNNE